MKKEDRNTLVHIAVDRLQEAAKLLADAEEELLSDQVSELADLIDVVAPSATDKAA